MKKDNITASILITTLLSVAFMFLLASRGTNGVIMYLLSIVAYCAILFGVSFLVGERKLNGAKIITGVVLLLGCILLADYVANVGGDYTNENIWTLIPGKLLFVIIILMSIIGFSFLNSDLSKVVSWPLYFMAAFAYGYEKYFPSPIDQNIFDVDAYVTSIYNVYYNIPIVWETKGIYGHYALFFKIPMMIFGAKWTTIAMMISVVCGITMLCYCYAIETLVKNALIKIMLVFVVLGESVYCFTDSYYASSPNRYVFPAIMMATMAYQYKHGKNGLLLGYVVSSLAFLWNIETGIGVILGWFVFSVARNIQTDKKIFSAKNLLHIVLVPVEMFSAVLVCSFYNICCGAKVDVPAFFYPFITQRDGRIAYVGHGLVAASTPAFTLPTTYIKELFRIMNDMYGFGGGPTPGNYAYVYVFCLLMGAIGWAVLSVLKNDNQNGLIPVVAAISTTGLVVFVYYMNRFFYVNAWVVMYEFAMVSAIVLDNSVKDIQNVIRTRKLPNDLYTGIKTTLAAFIFVAMISFSSLGILGVQKLAYNNLTGIKRNTWIQEYANRIAEVVPEGTPAVGLGTLELYSMLGWDTQFHYMDLPDITYDLWDLMYEDIYSRDAILVEKEIIDLYDDFLENGNFTEVQSWEIGWKTYYYLVKAD